MEDDLQRKPRVIEKMIQRMYKYRMAHAEEFDDKKAGKRVRRAGEKKPA